MESNHQSHADGHVGVGGKIEINLKHEGKDPQPEGEHRARLYSGQILRKRSSI